MSSSKRIPYPLSQIPATAYGTSRYFSPDGSLLASIRGRGQQPLTMQPDDSVERYPAWFTHSFANHQESMSVQDAAALTSGSPQFGVVDATITSAVGRPLFHSTWRNGARLEHAAFNQSVIGQPTAITRYQDPVNAANGVQWLTRMDSLGQILQVTEPVAGLQTRSYSSFGDLLSVVTTMSPEPAHGIVHTYDAFGRLTHSEEQDGGVADPTSVSDYGYDVGVMEASQVQPTNVLGRMATATAPTGSLFLSYDGLGRVNARVFAAPSDLTYVEQHKLHDDGSEATVELDLPDNGYLPERVDYGYDSAGRARSMLFSDGSSTLPLYNATTVDPFGRVRVATLANTTYHADFADVGRRLPMDVKVTSASSSRSISFDHWDALGRELARSEESPISAGSTGRAYDALGQLSSSTTYSGGSTSSNWNYFYDALGNVTKLSDLVGIADATLTYQAVDRDRNCRIGYGNNPPIGRGCNVSYDSFGNVINEPTRVGSRSISYFHSGQVREIDDSMGTAQFRYDPFGAVQELNVWASSGVRSDIHYGSRIALRSQTSSGYSTSYVSRQFAGPGVSISRRGAKGPWIFEIAEARGTRFTFDEKGNFTQDFNYQPYGETTSTGAVAGTPQYSTTTWNGGSALAEIGLVQVGARVFDPVIGRFLGRDPIRVARTSSKMNPYSFAHNDPVNKSDPTGLDPDDPATCYGVECSGDPGSWSSTFGGLPPPYVPAPIMLARNAPPPPPPPVPFVGQDPMRNLNRLITMPPQEIEMEEPEDPEDDGSGETAAQVSDVYSGVISIGEHLSEMHEWEELEIVSHHAGLFGDFASIGINGVRFMHKPNADRGLDVAVAGGLIWATKTLGWEVAAAQGAFTLAKDGYSAYVVPYFDHQAEISRKWTETNYQSWDLFISEVRDNMKAGGAWWLANKSFCQAGTATCDGGPVEENNYDTMIRNQGGGGFVDP